MAIDPEKPVDPNAPTAGPHVPVQVFPPPAQDDPSVTATSIRELREEVLRELESDTAPSDLGLNLATKVALVGLLVVSIIVIVLVLTRSPGEVPVAAGQPQAAPEPAVVTPAEPLPAVVPEPAPALPQPPSNPPAVPTPAPEMTEIVNADARLAEIAVIAALINDDPAFDDKTALLRLEPYRKSSEAKVKAAAEAAMRPVAARSTQRMHARVRELLEAAQEQLEAEDFSAVTKQCDAALEYLNAETLKVPELISKVEDFKKTGAQQRAEKFERAFDKLEAGLEASDPQAKERIAALLNHKDAEFASRAKEISTRVAGKLATARAEKLERDAAARKLWYEFYGKFQSAVNASDFDAAAALLKISDDSVMLQGGVQSPAEILAECAKDIASIRELQDAVLAKVAADKPRECDLVLKKGRVDGMLTGVQGRQLKVTLKGGASVTVKVETLTASAMRNILGRQTLDEKKLTRAAWIMAAYEAPAVAQPFLKNIDNGVIPLHWAEFFRLHAFYGRAAELERAFNNLEVVLEGDNADQIKEALNVLRPMVEEYEKTEPLSEARQKALSIAEKQVGRSKRMKLVLQNGTKPNEEAAVYNGQTTDQITDYKDNVKKTDVGTPWGLKLGASGGLQRVLLRFDNLEGVLGKARVLSATLEMYQIDSPQYAGAVIGLFRLKRPWAPDSGSWLYYNTAKQLEWAIPGAGGEADIEPREDARVSIDKNKNTWRTWDVTKYVSDVLTGKMQNNGFLVRVINSEPDYHVRFYPETDVENAKDAKLRPRLVLEIECELP